MGLQPRQPGRRGLHGAVLPAALALLHSAALAAGATDGNEAASPGGHKHKHKEAKGWRLLHHSFEHTLSFQDTLGDWLFSAASMPLRDRVELLPPVPDRQGIGFNKRSVDTSDFEVEFALGAVSPASGPEDGYVVFWVSSQNYTAEFNEQSIVTAAEKDWSKGMTDKGFTLLNNKPTFQGLALAFFADADKQTIAGLWNDGSKSVTMSDFTSGASHKEIDWLNKVVEAKVRFESSGAVAVHVAVHDAQELISGSTWGWASDGVMVDSEITFQKDGTTVPQGTWSMLPGNKLSLEFEGKPQKGKYVVRLEGVHRADIIEGAKEPTPSLMRADTGDSEWLSPVKQEPVQTKWQELLLLPAGTSVQQKSYIGFTGFSGTSTYVEADLHRLWMTNFDTRKVGEQDAGEAMEGGLDKEWLKLMEDEKRFLDQASQGEAIAELTKFLEEHVGQYEKVTTKLKGDLAGMETRTEELGSDIGNYLALLKAFNFDSSQFDPTEVKGSIVGIRSVLAKANEAHEAKLGLVHQAAKDLKARGGGTQMSEESKKKASTVQRQSEIVEEFAAAGSKSSSIMLLFLVLVVAGLGFLFFQRMRYYEKKHYI